MVKALLTLLMLSGAALAGDWQDLLKAVQKSRSHMPAGNVEVLVVFPPSNKPVKMRKDLPQLNFLPGLVKKNFELDWKDSQVIAGRNTTMYTLTPRNRLSNAWVIWVDDEWQVPVAYQQQDLDGTTLRRVSFQHFTGTLNKLEKPYKQKLGYKSEIEKRVLRAMPGLVPPQPYRVVGIRRAVFQDVPSIEVYLSDGLNVIPVVIAPKGVQEAEGVAVVRLDQQFVWVVAKLPPAELLRIIRHLTDIKPEQIFNPGE
ncbi:hypothetical protein [Deinococcus cellulosilyticus]|uniref:Uncharacterized protein n=1 Tax=Deinococcus cellulosilyticus (strain DSM 18568 / NBRC 106333 / KACC 11606 / 5516J-15) TaxID=1223518 RepID=A0A511N5A1_DEIC1|nr:hypothetical protein [Deinococcus cellulosilyticus]GEM48029.1 hypothetical protein DC3_36640 [Deinococcus cellulosilyticus NBRC 106333 = KACC 11606]